MHRYPLLPRCPWWHHADGTGVDAAIVAAVEVLDDPAHAEPAGSTGSQGDVCRTRVVDLVRAPLELSGGVDPLPSPVEEGNPGIPLNLAGRRAAVDETEVRRRLPHERSQVLTRRQPQVLEIGRASGR